MDKNIIPVVFCFDRRMEMPAGVCITSLLINARTDTFYDIYILHAEDCSFDTSRINALVSVYENCRLTYRSVGNAFNSAFEIRGITVAAYYRLLIPGLIPEYDKVIYSDVDVIFRDDLQDIFEHTDVSDSYVAGVVDASCFSPDHQKYIESLNLSCDEYIYSGNLIFNSALIRRDDLVQRFVRKVSEKDYKYQDMDVLNIVCKGKIKRMPPYFCLSTEISKYAANRLKQPLYTLEELLAAQSKGIVHYAGPKPWKQCCLNFDIWWEYYRKSIFFDAKFYHDFYYARINDYDRLSLWKRVKILVRYFSKGRLRI